MRSFYLRRACIGCYCNWNLCILHRSPCRYNYLRKTLLNTCCNKLPHIRYNSHRFPKPGIYILLFELHILECNSSIFLMLYHNHCKGLKQECKHHFLHSIQTCITDIFHYLLEFNNKESESAELQCSFHRLKYTRNSSQCIFHCLNLTVCTRGSAVCTFHLDYLYFSEWNNLKSIRYTLH